MMSAAEEVRRRGALAVLEENGKQRARIKELEGLTEKYVATLRALRLSLSCSLELPFEEATAREGIVLIDKMRALAGEEKIDD